MQITKGLFVRLYHLIVDNESRELTAVYFHRAHRLSEKNPTNSTMRIDNQNYISR